MREQMKSRYRPEDQEGVSIPRSPEHTVLPTPATERPLYIPHGTQLVTENFDRHGNRIILSHEEYITRMMALGVKLRLDEKRGEQ